MPSEAPSGVPRLTNNHRIDSTKIVDTRALRRSDRCPSCTTGDLEGTRSGRNCSVIRVLLGAALDRCVGSLFEYLMLTKIQFLLTFATRIPFPDKINNFEDARENIDKILYFFCIEIERKTQISRSSYHNFVENYILFKVLRVFFDNICFHLYLEYVFLFLFLMYLFLFNPYVNIITINDNIEVISLFSSVCCEYKNFAQKIILSLSSLS